MISLSIGKKHTIVCIALDQKWLQIITTYLSSKYHFIAVNHDFDISKLNVYSNIHLFIINTDSVQINLPHLLDQIKSNENLRNIPKIGLSLKQHHQSMPNEIRSRFEDFLLMPAGHEDMLTRVDVWIATYRTTFNPLEVNQKTYSLDGLSS